MRKGARLGQHFLIHSWAASALALAAPLQRGETILEIGAGKGILTRELLKQGPVVAIEKDAALVRTLRETFGAEIAAGELRLVEADIRDIVIEPRKTVPDARHGEMAREPYKSTVSATLRLRNEEDGIVLRGGYVVAANIPYYITGEIIRQFLTAPAQPRAMALLVQKEVAQRIVSDKESILSLSVKAYGKPRVVAKVPRKHFSPPPSVDSAILLVENINRDFFGDLPEKNFFDIVHAGFASKRKMLANNLTVHFPKEGVLSALATAHIDARARAEEVPLEKWKSIATALTQS